MRDDKYIVKKEENRLKWEAEPNEQRKPLRSVFLDTIGNIILGVLFVFNIALGVLLGFWLVDNWGFLQ